MSHKNEVGWSKCNKCDKIFPKSHVAQHMETCIEEGPRNITQSGFIEGNVLVAKATKNSTITKEKVNTSEKRGIIYLHINTIKVLQLHLGSLVVLHMNNKQVIRTLWPSSKIPLDNVGIDCATLRNYEISAGDTVEVHKLSRACRHANKVELGPSKPLEFDVSSHFIKFVAGYLDNMFLCLGEVVEVPYYGKMRQFAVTMIETDTGTYTTSVDDTCLLSGFKSLCLGENEDDIVSDCLSSSTNRSIFGTDISQELSTNIGNNESAISLDTTDTSKYYSLLQDSIESDGGSEFGMGNSERYTSTPLKQNHQYKECSVALPTACCRCASSETVVCCVTASVTVFSIVPSGDNKNDMKKDEELLSYDSVGGLTEQISILKEIVQLPFSNAFKSFGLMPPTGVLLYGPSGTGKTLLAKTVAMEASVYSTTLNGPDVLSRYYGETEAKLREIFQDAQNNSPSIIFIDELDALCPKRDKVQNEFEKRVVATLLTLMDGLATSRRERVVVIAATNRPEFLDAALRRPGRLEKEIEIGIPKASDRADILHKLLNKTRHCVATEQIIKLADNAHGFVGADLMAVVKEAGMNVLRRNDMESCNDDDVLLIGEDDLRQAFQHVRPSGLREIAIDVPKVYWNDIGGNEIVKQKLRQAIEWPLKHPEAFTRMGIDPPKGILMYGPPGCSKTLIAKALATESGLNFIAVKGPEIFNKWVGESERAVRQVFHKARTAAPCVVFFDEIDAVANKRGSSEGEGSNVSERVLTQLLTELDGVEALNDVTLVAATNRPDVIDRALMRPGRIDRIIYIPLPDLETRTEIFKIHLKNTPVTANVDIEELAGATQGYSGAEITAVCREAALAALQEDIDAIHVEYQHFQQAIATIKPRISSDLIQYYTKFQQQCGVHCL